MSNNWNKILMIAVFSVLALNLYAQPPITDELIKNSGATPDQIEAAKEYLEGQNNQSEGLDVKTEGIVEKPEIVVELKDTVKEEKKKIIKPLKKQEEVFGQAFFDNGLLEIIDKSSKVQPPNSYVLNEGDEINISIWGYSDYEGSFVIDEGGAIKPNLVGRISLKGKSFESAKSIIKQRFGYVYDIRNSNIEVTLKYSRNITVNMVGEVRRPGSFTIPAINTAFNVLNLSEGIKDIGSVRNIQIKRNGKTHRVLDLYKFLLNPDAMTDYFLEDNDFIFVPVQGKVVTINGQVKRPHKYELNPSEKLSDLVTFSGGIKANAVVKLIQIKRYEGDEKRLIDVDYEELISKRKDYDLKDGDEVIINEVPSSLVNFISISGAIKIPGDYELANDMKVSDVIMKAGGTENDAYTSRIYVVRLTEEKKIKYIAIDLSEVNADNNHPDNIKLEPFDKIKISSQSEFAEDYKVNISGLVYNPGEYDFAEKMTLKDLLYFSGGLKREAANYRIEISRVIDFDIQFDVAIDEKPRAVIETIEIGKELELDDLSKAFELKPYDHIYVRKNPNFLIQETIQINGEIMYPGEYALEKGNERVLDIILRAGGYTDLAYLEGATLFRSDPLSEGAVLLDLAEIQKDEDSEFNYILLDGDVLNVPKMKDLVKLTGEINYLEINKLSKINVPYKKGKKAKYYIKKYGAGFTKTAKKGRIFVKDVNGETKISKGFIFKSSPKVKLGSEVIVQAKENKKNRKENKKNREPVDWNKTIESFTIKATGILTLYLLFKQVF